MSFVEDAIAIFLAWLAAEHPVITAILVAVLVVIAGFIIWKLLGFFKRSVERVKKAYRKAVAETASG